jgi:hypothetical protein
LEDVTLKDDFAIENHRGKVQDDDEVK